MARTTKPKEEPVQSTQANPVATKSQAGSVPDQKAAQATASAAQQPAAQVAATQPTQQTKGTKHMGYKVDTTTAKKQLILPRGRYGAVKTKWERGESAQGRPMYTRTFVLTDDNEPVQGMENRAGNLIQVDDEVNPAGTEMLHWSMPDTDGLSSWMNDAIAMGADAEDIIDNPDLDTDEVESATVGQPVILIVDIDKKRNPTNPQNVIRGILPAGA